MISEKLKVALNEMNIKHKIMSITEEKSAFHSKYIYNIELELENYKPIHLYLWNDNEENLIRFIISDLRDIEKEKYLKALEIINEINSMMIFGTFALYGSANKVVYNYAVSSINITESLKDELIVYISYITFIVEKVLRELDSLETNQ